MKPDHGADRAAPARQRTSPERWVRPTLNSGKTVAFRRRPPCSSWQHRLPLGRGSRRRRQVEPGGKKRATAAPSAKLRCWRRCAGAPDGGRGASVFRRADTRTSAANDTGQQRQPREGPRSCACLGKDGERTFRHRGHRVRSPRVAQYGSTAAWAASPRTMTKTRPTHAGLGGKHHRCAARHAQPDHRARQFADNRQDRGKSMVIIGAAMTTGSTPT